MCRFCNSNFYADDQLYQHMHESHETCHLCVKEGVPNAHSQFYHNYDALEAHFGAKHYLCTDALCREKKFVVFSSDVALQAHVNNVHSRSNKIEVNFTYRRLVRWWW